MLFSQCLKFGCAGISSLAHDEHALPAARAIRKDQVVGERENPLASRVEKEREILHVIVAVVSKDIEAGQREGLFGILDIPGQRQGHAQNRFVIEAGTAMIGMYRAAKAVHMDTGIVVPVEAFVPKYLFLFVQKRWVSDISTPASFATRL